MGARIPPMNSDISQIGAITARLRSIEESLRDRALPPGYHYNIVAGNLVVTREADGLTANLVFT